MTAIARLDDADIAGKRVLVRVDFNAPMENGRVTDDTRLRAALPTIVRLRERGAKVILASHFGRPRGKRVEAMSLEPMAGLLSALLGARVAFAADSVGPAAAEAVAELARGDVLLLENTRFHAGEEANDEAYARALAANADIYVNDAFSAAHRAHASTEGVARLLPAYPGLALARELDHLARALGEAPARPVVAIVGGAKVSTKIELLGNLVAKVDVLAIGGAMANTFLLARGLEIGASYAERDQLNVAREIEAKAAAASCEIYLPVDVVVAERFEAHAPHRSRPAAEVQANEMILDIGSVSVDEIAERVNDAKTCVWNGPMGAFELEPFDTSTVELAKFVAGRTKAGALVSVAGGGDTVAALNHAGVGDDFTFVSTAGGAFLEWLEGRKLPGVEALKR